VRRAIHDLSPLEAAMQSADRRIPRGLGVEADEALLPLPEEAFDEQVSRLQKQMRAAAEKLEFEKAAELRDRLHALKQTQMGLGEKGEMDDVLRAAEAVEARRREGRGRRRAQRHFRGGKP
jgi:excinuclease UvrABC nuclease subunit